MEAEKYLYYYEHKLIPEMFYQENIDFFGVLAEDPGALFAIFNDACKGNRIQHTFTPDDFCVAGERMDDDYLCLTLTFPIPQRVPLCFEMYLFQKRDLSGKGCYTLERSKNIKGEDVLVLGGWGRKEDHLNFGSFPMEDADFCAKAFAIHKQNEQGEPHE